MFNNAKLFIRSIASVHYPDNSPNIFIFSMPRSGSTWLMELIWSQPGFKPCNEPLNIRDLLVRQYLGITSWEELYSQDATDKLAAYFQGWIDGRLRFKNPKPFARHYRFVTRRIVFKVIHGCEDRINWLKQNFNGRVVYLLRHPLAVSISREALPRLEAFVNSDYARHFRPEQLAYARDIILNGSHLDKGVLSWCFQNVVPLRDKTEDWVVLTYEQAVLEPTMIVQYLTWRLNFPEPNRMAAQIKIPSGVSAKSDADTQALLQKSRNQNTQQALVEKWRLRVREAEGRKAMGILAIFGLDPYYTYDDNLPNKQLWVRFDHNTIDTLAEGTN
jgi:hypothetical protein